MAEHPKSKSTGVFFYQPDGSLHRTELVKCISTNDALLSLSNAAALIDGIEGCPQVNPLCFIEDFKAEWDDCILAELTPEEEVWSQYLTEAFTKFAIYGLVRIQSQSV